jgi:hypothetical protein
MSKAKKLEGLKRLSVPPSMRVIDPTDNRVCVHGPSCYATMCGLADDADPGIVYGTRRAVTCQACVDAVLYASQFLVKKTCGSNEAKQ